MSAPDALARWLCFNLVALMAVIVAWGLTSNAPHPVATTAITAAPLLLPLPGLWRRSRYTAAWASLLTVPYLVLGVVERVANPAARALAVAELALSFTLFAGLLLAARRFARTA